MARFRTPRQAGFTLAELMVVVATLGIFFAMAGIGFGDLMRSHRARGVQRLVYAELQRARSQAVMRNHRARVGLQSNVQIKLHDDVNGNGAEDAGEPIKATSIAAEYPSTTLAVSTTIVFAPNGTAPTPGTVTVTHPGGATTVVEVTAAGRIKVP